MDMTRASTCTYPLREQSLDYAFEVVAGAGFNKLDLWGRAPHFSTDPDEVKPQDIEALVQSSGVRVANLGSYPGADFDSAEEDVLAEAMAQMRATIDLAKRFGARSIRVLPGHGEDPGVVDAIAEPFRQAADYAAQKGIYLGMENHRGSIAGVLELAVKLCRLVDSPFFGVLYEPCNLMAGGVDYKEAFEAFRDDIVHVHIKDGRWTDGAFQRHHLGHGDIDMRWVVQALAGIDYQGDYALEYEICDIEPIETGLVKWYEYWENL